MTNTIRDLDQQQLTYQTSGNHSGVKIRVERKHQAWHTGLLHSIHLVVIKHTTQARMGPGLKVARTNSNWPALYVNNLVFLIKNFVSFHFFHLDISAVAESSALLFKGKQPVAAFNHLWTNVIATWSEMVIILEILDIFLFLQLICGLKTNFESTSTITAPGYLTQDQPWWPHLMVYWEDLPHWHLFAQD